VENHATELKFEGVRVQLSSKKTYDQLLASLLEDIGESPVDLATLDRAHSSWETYKAAVRELEGPSGFMLFGLIDHGAWVAKAGASQRSMRVILGNPTLAITMLRHDMTAGLFAPVEFLLLEKSGDESCLVYVKPSSLMVVEKNDELLSAAQALDKKLHDLAVKVTG
jgi:uncharacterized protein (DUF302 family)